MCERCKDPNAVKILEEKMRLMTNLAKKFLKNVNSEVSTYDVALFCSKQHKLDSFQKIKLALALDDQLRKMADMLSRDDRKSNKNTVIVEEGDL